MSLDISQLKHFRCYSRNDNFPDLWGKSIEIIFDQFMELVKINGFNFEISDPKSLESSRLDEFANSFNEKGSDKTGHGYHYVYSWIFDQININNFMEIGLGTNNPTLVSSMGADGKPGASLRSFKQLIPSCQIYGADIDRDILFEESQIKTFFVDQLDYNTFNNLPNIKYDLIIDDGLHQIGANFNTLLWSMKHLNKDGFIAIEDIIFVEPWITISYIIQQNTDFICKIYKCNMCYLFLVKKVN